MKTIMCALSKIPWVGQSKACMHGVHSCMRTRTKGMVPVYRCDGCCQSAHPYREAVCALIYTAAGTALLLQCADTASQYGSLRRTCPADPLTLLYALAMEHWQRGWYWAV